MSRRVQIFRCAKKGAQRKAMTRPSDKGFAAAWDRREDIRLALMAFTPLRREVEDHVNYLIPYVARAWDTWDPKGGSSWRVWGLQPVYWHAGRLISKALNRGLHVPKEERRRIAESGHYIRITSTDYVLPGGDVVVNLIPTPPPADRAIADATTLLRRWLSERLASTNAERAALEVMTRRANGEEITMAAVGRRYKLSRERVRQVYLQLEADFRDAHPELKKLLREAA